MAARPTRRSNKDIQSSLVTKFNGLTHCTYLLVSSRAKADPPPWIYAGPAVHPPPYFSTPLCKPVRILASLLERQQHIQAFGQVDATD